MRRIWLALPGMFLVGAWVLAQPGQQQPPLQQPPAPPADPQLDAVLLQWEKAMTSMQSVEAICTRTSINKAFQTTEVYEGNAKFLKTSAQGTPSRASLEMYKKGRPDVFEKYIFTGTFFYEYVPSSKIIRVHEPPKGQMADDNFVSFVFGMKAAEAKNRYQIIYVPAPPNDKWYYYLRILPKLPSQKADFTEARLVLSASTFLPRQLWFQEPNGNEVTWDFPKIMTNAALRATDFGQPALPKDWRFIRNTDDLPGNIRPPQK